MSSTPAATDVREPPPTPFERAVDLSSRALYLVLPGLFFFPPGIAALRTEWKTSTFLLLFSGFLGCIFAVSARFTRKINRTPWVMLLSLLAAEYYLFISLVRRDVVELIPPGVVNVIMLAGIFLSMSGKLWLGRSFGVVPANRGVVMTGPYRLVRHPIYLGYMMCEIGFLLASFSLRNLIVTVVGEILQMLRILQEEKVLKQDPAYAEYARDRVRYRLFPYIF